MKTKINILALFLFTLSSHAAETEITLREEGTRGGGDQCENRIQEIRDDIASWIAGGGAKALKLPAGISTADYGDKMNAEISRARISCVGPGDTGFPVTIQDASSGKYVAKTCVFDRAAGTVTCDQEKFNSLATASDQYVLVHHEFAGLAGIENPDGAVSRYHVSNQISAYLESAMVTKLAVRPSTEGQCATSLTREAICTAIVPLPLEETVRRLETVRDRLPVLWEGAYPKSENILEIETIDQDTVELAIQSGSFNSYGLRYSDLSEVGKNKLGPFTSDRILARLVRRGNTTLVLLNGDSQAGGSPGWKNLAGCQLRGVKANDCASFEFSFAESGGFRARLQFDQVLGGGLEDDDIDAELVFNFDGGQTFSFYSRYSDGNDLGDDDIVESRWVGKEKTFNFRTGAHSRN